MTASTELAEKAPLGAAAFFDLDKTVIAKAAMAAFSGPLYNGGLLNRRGVTRFVLSQLVYLHLGATERRLERLQGSLLRLVAGWSQPEIAAIVADTLAETLEPIIYGEALELFEEHRRAGRLVVLVSAAPEEIVVPLGRHLGVDEVVSSRAEVDDSGRYTGQIAFCAFGPYKASAMRELADRRGIDLDASYAYSDSYTDLPMLEAVGHPVAVNPDRVLARLARERHWEVRHFVRPVRLSERVRFSAPRPAIGVVVAAVVGAAAIRALTRRAIGSAGRLDQAKTPQGP